MVRLFFRYFDETVTILNQAVQSVTHSSDCDDDDDAEFMLNLQQGCLAVYTSLAAAFGRSESGDSSRVQPILESATKFASLVLSDEIASANHCDALGLMADVCDVFNGDQQELARFFDQVGTPASPMRYCCLICPKSLGRSSDGFAKGVAISRSQNSRDGPLPQR